MLITSVLPLDKKRSRIWLDGEFAFVLYKGELRRFKIEEGKELEENIYKEIISELLPKRAKLRAMNLLKSHTYSVKQLQDKLRENLYPEDIIEEALSYVAGYGYTDDLRLSEEYIRIHLSDKSKQRIVIDLSRKGISKDVIDRAFTNCSEYGFEQDELSQARTLMVKRGNPEGISAKKFESYEAYRKEYAKQYSFLLRKGYSANIVNSVLGGSFDED